MDEILISRYGEIVESREDAVSILLKRQFKKGEPCIINYRDGEGGIGTITAIGIKEGSGKEAYSIVSAGSLIYVQSVIAEGAIDVSITVNGEKYLWKDERGKWNIVEIEGSKKKVTPITTTPRTYIDLSSGNIYVSTETRDVYCLNSLDKRFITKEELEKILEDYQLKTIESEEETTPEEGISKEDVFNFVMDYFNSFKYHDPVLEVVEIWYDGLSYITKEYISKLLQEAREKSKTCTYKINLGFGETLIDNTIRYTSTLDDIENSYLIFRFPENTVELNNVEENFFFFEVDQNRTGRSWIPSTFSKPQEWTGEMWMSDQNKGVDSSTDSLYIKTTSLTDQEFTIYIASNSEADSDYVIARELDSDTQIKIQSKGNIISSPSDSISNYISVKYQIPGDGQIHYIRIDYKKDGLNSQGLDRGFLLINPNLPDQ